MTNTPDNTPVPAAFDEIHTLVVAQVQNGLSPDQHTRLEALLAENPTNRELYLDYVSDSISLRYLLGDQHEDPTPRVNHTQAVGHASRDEDTAVPARGACPTPRPKSLLNWASRHPKGPAIAIAATLLMAALVVMGLVPVKEWVAGGGKAKPEEQKPGEKEVFVARLSNWHNDVWLEDTRPPLDDPRLKVGRRLKIEAGVIEVTYLTGARVVIEGPAEFVIGRKQGTAAELARKEAGRGSLSRSEDEGGRRKKEGHESEGHPSSFTLHPSNAGYLALGSLVARVEGKDAQGFTIDTPNARVEDLSTEFGVLVDKSGHTELQVTEGEVKLRAIGPDGVFLTRHITADHAVRVAGQQVDSIPFVARRFARITPAVEEQAVASFDVDVDGSATMPGFASMPARQNSKESSATQNGIRCRVSATGFRYSKHEGRLAESPRRDLLRDFARVLISNGETMEVYVSGLQPSKRYRLRWFHYNNRPIANQNRRVANPDLRMSLYRDKPLPENQLIRSRYYGTLADPAVAGHSDFYVSSDEQGEITLVTESPSSGSSDKPVFCGLRIYFADVIGNSPDETSKESNP